MKLPTVETPVPLTRLKFVAELRAGGTPPVNDPRFWREPGDAEGHPWAAIADLTREPLLRTTARRVSDLGVIQAGLTVGRPGTLLLAMYASLGTTGRLVVPGCWNQAILGITPRVGHESRFIEYVLNAMRPQLGRWARSNTQDNLNAEQVGNLPVPAVPERCQQEVVHFLDRECQRLADLGDRLKAMSIVAAESWLARARELIGVDRHPNVQLRYVTTTGTGHTPSRTRPDWWDASECVIPWFTLADVHQIRNDATDIVIDTSEHISHRGLANSSAVLHPPGTVLLSRTASVGFSAIMGVGMAVSQDFMTWTCSAKLDPRYLLYRLRTSRPDLRRLMYGSTHKTIYMHDLLALRTPLPSREQQRVAVRALDELSASHRAASDAIAQMRSRLAEYRHALIREAVTGRIDIAAVSDNQMDELLQDAIEAPGGE